MGNETFKNTLSVSQMGAFQDCQYKWQLMYKEGIRIRKGEINPSAVGSVFHEGIAAALRKLFEIQFKKMKPQTKFKKLMQAADGAIKEWSAKNFTDKRTPVLNEEGEVIMIVDADYETAWAEMLKNASLLIHRTLVNTDMVNRYEVVGHGKEPLVEYWLEVPLWNELSLPVDSFGFVGVVDAVLHDTETGINFVVDWKLHKHFTTLDQEQLNAQIALYQHALLIGYGINTQAGIVYQIKSDPPRKPDINKNGTMSRRKITSDWATYEEALIEIGEDPADYIEEMQPKLADVEFFRPLTVFRSYDITQLFWDNLVSFAQTIIKTVNFPMALGYSCRTCIFSKLCTARLYDYDEGELFETIYLKEDYIPAIVEEEEEDLEE